jgi:hypothetical protein
MTKAIYKYKLYPRFGIQTVKMPVGAEILSVQEQQGSICIWALVNTSRVPIPNRVVDIIGTGINIHECELFGETFMYIGSVQMGVLVFHVFIDKR